MDISAIIKHKKDVDEALVLYLNAKQQNGINAWQKDLVERLIPFVTSGKSIRGSLLIFSYLLFNPNIAPLIYNAAAGIELFHSGFLIHDDIMDQDTTRRGHDAIHIQFKKHPDISSTGSADHFGISMGINAADFCFFCGYELLSSAPQRLIKQISQELAIVTTAQMQDVYASVTTDKLTENDILSVYRYKTARYTFSLPLMIGASLAGANDEAIEKLDKLGEDIGIIFQIRDDELSLVGDSAKTGKPVGNDQREHKQTLLSYFVQMDNPTIDVPSLSADSLKELYIDSPASNRIQEYMNTRASTIEKVVQTLSISEENKNSLRALAQFVQTREN